MAVEIIFRKSLDNPEEIKKRTEEYEDRFLNPFVAAERGYIDEVIQPRNTRMRICRSGLLKGKKLITLEKTRQYSAIGHKHVSKDFNC